MHASMCAHMQTPPPPSHAPPTPQTHNQRLTYASLVRHKLTTVDDDDGPLVDDVTLTAVTLIAARLILTQLVTPTVFSPTLVNV